MSIGTPLYRLLSQGRIGMDLKILMGTCAVLFALTGMSYAAHPLITDDTGTQGKGKYQFEFVGEYGHGKENGVTTDTFVIPTVPVLSYGMADTVDLVLSISYQRIETKMDDITTTKRGISDAFVQVKWRFYEKDEWSCAMKPGATLPTGDENKGLGNGKSSYSMFFITTKELHPWALHLDLGYIHNEYKLQADEDANRKDIWHASLASEVKVLKDLKAVADIGIERNSDRTSNTDPAFLLAGLVHSITESVDVDFGVKGGLTRPETNISYLAGLTCRF
jgi:hypothetical protein